MPIYANKQTFMTKYLLPELLISGGWCRVYVQDVIIIHTDTITKSSFNRRGAHIPVSRFDRRYNGSLPVPITSKHHYCQQLPDIEYLYKWTVCDDDQTATILAAMAELLY